MIVDNVKQAALKRLRIGYFDGRLFRIARSENTWQMTETSLDSVIDVMIVAKEYVAESCRRYPVAAPKELKGLLKLEQIDHALITHTTATESWVNSWVFKNDVPRAKVRIPETVVLSADMMPPNAVAIQRQWKDHRSAVLYIGKNQLGLHSAVKNSIVSSLSRFVQATGLALDATSHNAVSNDSTGSYSPNTAEYTRNADADSLIQGMLALPLAQWLPFFRVQSHSIDKASLMKLAGTSLVVFFAYLGLSSGYLYYQHSQVSHAYEAQKATLGDAFDTLDAVSALSQQKQALRVALADYAVTSHAWLIFASIFEQADVTQIKRENQRYVIYGKAQKATDLLTSVVKMPGVKDARFEGTVTRRGNKDNFILGFELMPDTPSEQNQEALQ
ncbi:hypothetical protein OE749_01095 [Aestuariibacter sp. AA17]|uniref:Uncharacterized protein n=1 Tax=Fluctibacter corallii TaxID=2984329 RepID=A0ABT3A3N6_9ALTE|nr:hypothetical protein [Aestuariibacter sp. AA17]MCV2883290.1 hypothetical protein [Aestuariibacter sp. AA17]